MCSAYPSVCLAIPGSESAASCNNLEFLPRKGCAINPQPWRRAACAFMFASDGRGKRVHHNDTAIFVVLALYRIQVHSGGRIGEFRRHQKPGQPHGVHTIFASLDKQNLVEEACFALAAGGISVIESATGNVRSE